ncbi:MAG: DUF4342 domain-containing protein [Candidatus Levybacteria bacterium]|nr:DUF4342 domain-containing protein [Candidatus Levybacteria bacterium]
MADAKSKAEDKKEKKEETKNESGKNESFRVQGENLLKKVNELIKEGNVRRITIKDKNGKNVIVIPLTFGVVGAVIAPVLAGIGAIAALIGECTITVERE